MEARFGAGAVIINRFKTDHLKIYIMSKHSKKTEREERDKAVERVSTPNRTDQDANADTGGTTDMDSSIRKKHSTGTGSGMATKRSVSGSDFDGQVVDQ